MTEEEEDEDDDDYTLLDLFSDNMEDRIFIDPYVHTVTTYNN
jgi:hypothetical protein